MKTKQNFIEEADILEQWHRWKDSNALVEERTVSDKFATQIMTIAQHLLTHNKFNRYPQYAKEEMAQDAYIKCHKNLKNYNPAKGTLFSYLTRCCWTAFVTYLVKYYKDMNTNRQMLLDALGEIETNPDIHSSAYLDELKRRLKDLECNVNEDDGRTLQCDDYVV